MDDAKTIALTEAQKDQLWKKCEEILGGIIQISLIGPKTPEEIQLAQGCCGLVAAEIVSRIRAREKEQES